MKVAILIPTMNRPDFIERTIAYYDSLKSLHPIYIGDASPPGIAAQTLACLKRFSNVDVKYFHWERLGANQTIVKLAESAQAVCQYCAFHGDDDYFVPSSLSQCAEFLSVNADYRTAQGRAAFFSLDRPGPYGEIRSLGDYWGVNALEQENSVERLVSFEKKYFVLQFSTHRTEEFVQDCRPYFEIKDPLVGELLHCAIFAIKGKSKFLDCLYLVRNHHDGAYHPDFLDWIVQEHWASDYQKMQHALSVALQEASDLPLVEATRVISETLRLQLERSVGGSFYKRSLSVRLRNASRWYLKNVISHLINQAGSALPSYLRNVIRHLIDQTRGASDMRLLRSEKSLFYDKFLPVSSSLAKVASPKGRTTLE